MRFKKYILLSLVLCGFAACSDDNEIEIPKAPVLEKAQLALAIKSEEGAVTKAGETTPTDADVNTLTVGVFGVDGWSVIYTKDATPNSDGTKDVGPQEVYAGEAHVVVVTRVHHMEKGYAMPPRVTDDSNFYPKRYRQICNWEQYLYENGYRVVKVYLNVSRDEQKRRFLDRLEREDKHWKLSVDDMRERRLWKQYDEAFEDAINATATKESPWYVLPADDKWFTRYLMSEILLDVLMDVNPDYPPLDPAEAAKVPAILAELENGE